MRINFKIKHRIRPERKWFSRSSREILSERESFSISSEILDQEENEFQDQAEV